MFKNYCKIALRRMAKHKTDTIINLVGLSVAFTCALLLFLSVYFEFSYDNFHRNGKNIYQVYTNTSQREGVRSATSVPVPMMPALKQAYPEVQYASRFISRSGNIRYGDKQLSLNLRLTDPDFFRMFTFPFIDGSAQSAMQDLNGLVLTRKAANIIFGSVDAVGKNFQMQMGGEWKPFMVSAVVADIPNNSSIDFDLAGRFELDENYVANSTNWDNWNPSMYVQLKEGTTPESLVKKAGAFYNQYFAENAQALKRDGAKPFADGAFMQLGLLPLSKMHTEPELQVEGSGISANYLYLLLAIGVLILLIAVINFINLSIGRSFARAHEIGLRKTIGARKGQLVTQLWVEAFMVCLFALLVSGLLAYALLPHFTQLFHVNISRDLLRSPLVWMGVLAAFVLVTMLAGGYPAWLIARVNIISILKGKFSIARSQGIRNTLMIVQFSIAVLLLICTFVSWQQVDYLRSRPLGYNRSQVISIPIESDQDPNLVLQRLCEKLDGYHSVLSVSGIYNNLGRGLDGSTRSSVIGFEYNNRNISSQWIGVSHDFVQTLDLQLVAGRDFNRALGTDSNAMVINEAMARQLEAKEVIGLQLPVHDSATPMTVIGVVKDFNYESLHKKITPMSFVIEKDFGVHYALIKVAPTALPASMDLMKQTWKQVLPNSDFKGSFLDDNIDRQYRREEKMGQIFISGAIIAIVLSCMGLLAMVLLIVTQKVKEIGIRKVLGASVPHIVLLIAKQFMWLVGIAILIAAPLAWWGMQQWLQGFAYRTPVHWTVFAGSGLLALLIAFVTISIQAMRAATANPVKSLRTE